MSNLKHVAITGIGETEYARVLAPPLLDLLAKASRKAIADAGLRPEDIDGYATTEPECGRADELASVLGVKERRFTAQMSVACAGVTGAARLAQMAISCGMARHVLEADPAALVAAAPPSFLGRPSQGPESFHRYLRQVIDGRVLPRPVLDAVAGGSASGVAVIAGTCREEALIYMFPSDLTVDALPAALSGRWVPNAVDVSSVLAAYRQARAARFAAISPTDLASGVATDVWMRQPAIRLLEGQRKHSAPCYHYIFSWISPFGDGVLQAAHGTDIGFTFGTYARDADHAAMFGAGPAAAALAAAFQDALAAFARTGDPSTESLGAWPAYGDSRATMILGEHTRIVEAPYEQERKAWERYSNDVLSARGSQREDNG